MQEYDFTLVATHQTMLTPDKVCELNNALIDAGADDCVLLVKGNTLIIEFGREAESYEMAVISAINNLHSIDGIAVQSVDAGQFVSLSDAAEMANLSRSTLSKFSTGARGDGNFPSPRFKASSKAPLYEWKEISSYLAGRGLIDTVMAENAAVTAKINTALMLKNGKFEDIFALSEEL